jgi:His-Xaa-Ser system protein HxsD
LPNTPLTRRMRPTRLMLQAANGSVPSPVGIVVDFDSSIQSLGALDAAAYRLIGTATCQIDRVGDRYVCRVTPSASPQKRESLSGDDLRERFLNLVSDENLRIRVTQKTEGVRNVILALAFGSLAADQKNAG